MEGATTLADSFLQDLLDLAEDEEGDVGGVAKTSETGTNAYSKENAVLLSRDGGSIANEQVENTGDGHRISSIFDNADFCSFISHIQSVLSRSAEDKESQCPRKCGDILQRCNNAVFSLDKEILDIFGVVRDIYRKRFPELDAVVPAPLEYMACVSRLGNDPVDASQSAQLANLLPTAAAEMTVLVAGSNTTGEPLSPAELSRALAACREALTLADWRRDVLVFLESQMHALAPNVTVIVGAAMAARLVVHAGSLEALARMPAQNIAVLGSAGSTARQGGQTLEAGKWALRSKGVITSSDLVVNLPAALQKKALRMLACKVGLAARVDSCGGTSGAAEDSGGAAGSRSARSAGDATNGPEPDKIGAALRAEIISALTRAQKRPPAPLKKSLPVPDDGPRKRRGGKRWRKLKEKMGLNDKRGAEPEHHLDGWKYNPMDDDIAVGGLSE